MSNSTMIPPGTQVQLGDKYEMKRPLASGGAARIFLATQLALEREVVVKVLRPQLSQQSEFCQRFAQEAKLIAHLEHPNIVQIIDFGIQEGYYYFVMEYVRGGSLRDLLDRADHIPVDVVLSLAYLIAKGLGYVHDHHILHLDIKPANILLTRSGGVKVADFGLARLVSGTEEERDEKRRHPAGTPLYMSPEQVQGSNLDARSDIFSFGILLYQLLTFRNPFAGRTTDEVYRHILACRVQPPSRLRPEIPIFVDDLVIACLQRDRAVRFTNANSLIASLHTALENLGVHRPEERVQRYLGDPIAYRAVLKKTRNDTDEEGESGRGRKWLKAIGAIVLGLIILAVESWVTNRYPGLNPWR